MPVEGFSASTHTLPLNLLCDYLTHEIGCAIMLIGIQVGDTRFGQSLTAPVKSAVRQVVRALVQCMSTEMAA
jgi:Ni,Fe-hydrogenase maturation factor